MKILFFLLIPLFLFNACSILKPGAKYEPGCKTFFVDVESGKLNGVKAKAPMEKVKEMFPCFSGESPEEGSTNCGGGVFFDEENFYFYTGSDYIEIRFGFKGNFSEPIITRGETELKTVFGEPVKTVEDGDSVYQFYPRKYGALVIQFVNGKAMNFSMHSKKAEDIKLCL